MNKSCDKVSEAYNGMFGEKRQNDVRNRIEWITKNVKGDFILDIGCSQGICESILAPLGKTITAIDVETESIEYAKNQDFANKQNVTFLCCDFLEHDFNEEKYDTILITEVLEHLYDPQQFIKKAQKLIKEDGKLIITVPFGINDCPDHKRTYYFAEIYQHIKGLFYIQEYEVLGDWIGFVCTLENNREFKVDNDVLKVIEQSFYKRERILTDKSVKRGVMIEKYKKENENLSQKLEECEKRLQEEAAQHKLEIETKIKEDAFKLQQETDAHQRDINSFKNIINTLKNEYKILSQSKLGRLQLKYWKVKNRNSSVSVLDKVNRMVKKAEKSQSKSISKVKVKETKKNEVLKLSDYSVSKDGAVLFMCTNGAGLGHLTRSLAIAKRIRKDDPSKKIVFLTTSIAVNAVNAQGFYAYHIPPKGLLGDDIDSKMWGDMLKESLERIFSFYNIETVVFDGAFPYAQFVRTVKSQRNVKRIWVKRGGEKEGTDGPRKEREKDFNNVIIPAEAGNELNNDDGFYVNVNPIIFIDDNELLSRDEVRRLFKVPDDKKLVYVQLGAGNINDIDSQLGKVINKLRERGDIMIVLGESIISSHSLNIYEKDIYVVKDYPNSKYFKGFDFVISACGYNSFNEIMYLNVPSLFLPNMETKTDDQYGRAMIAEKYGAGLVLHSVSDIDDNELEEKINILSDDAKNSQIRENLKKISIENGAVKAAKFILED